VRWKFYLRLTLGSTPANPSHVSKSMLEAEAQRITAQLNPKATRAILADRCKGTVFYWSVTCGCTIAQVIFRPKGRLIGRRHLPRLGLRYYCFLVSLAVGGRVLGCAFELEIAIHAFTASHLHNLRTSAEMDPESRPRHTVDRFGTVFNGSISAPMFWE
jgi:hypothetical protein